MIENSVLRIKGMTCALCSFKIESSLVQKEGIQKVIVNYASEKAKLSFDNELLQIDDIKRAIESLGFRVEDIGTNNIAQEQKNDSGEQKKLRNLLIVSIILSSPLMLGMILGVAGFCHETFDPASQTALGLFIETLRYRSIILHNWKLQLIAATPVQFIVGFRFYRNAFYAVKSKNATMDLLVAIGTSAAYFYSVYICFFKTLVYTSGMLNIYFEASSTIITLVLLGKYLEMKAKDRTSDAIRSLLRLKPETAQVIRNGEELTVPIGEVMVDDLLIIRPGDKIPVDGYITEGYSTVDESMLTGESVLVEKQKNDMVYEATINKYGTFRFKAKNIGNETFLAKIIRLVEEAQESKAPIQKTADKVCRFFVPSVLIIASATFMIWFCFIYKFDTFMIFDPILFAVSVLVVSCPCALGLATPAALMVGMGVGAKKGVLIKNGEHLETACRINTMVLDKTGTLTLGKPTVTDIIPVNNEDGKSDPDELLHLAAVAEKGSEHPLGKAIYAYARDILGSEPEAAEEFEALPGMGVRAVIGGLHVMIGTEKLLSDNGIDIGQVSGIIESFQKQGKMIALLSVENSLRAVITLSDTIKPESREMVAMLHKMGTEVIMLTGDNKNTADFVAWQIGIKHVIAEVLPDNKAEVVKRLKAEGKNVGMLGDGINDAPAMASADIGFTVGTGTDVAIETCDIMLLNDNLLTLPLAIQLSKKVMRKIKQNLFWAFIYNAVAIPIAASGHLNPVVAAAAMALSSVSVLLNSLSLKRFR